jgi:hypothetical protein
LLLVVVFPDAKGQPRAVGMGCSMTELCQISNVLSQVGMGATLPDAKSLPQYAYEDDDIKLEIEEKDSGVLVEWPDGTLEPPVMTFIGKTWTAGMASAAGVLLNELARNEVRKTLMAEAQEEARRDAILSAGSHHLPGAN